MLYDLHDWQADNQPAATALGAVTGLNSRQATAIIAELAAAKGGASADPFDHARGRTHWQNALVKLGFKINAYQFEGEWASLPTIAEYLEMDQDDRLMLVYCINESRTETHVFAIQDGALVDTYTEGKVTTADPALVPNFYGRFRVIGELELTPPEALAAADL